MRKLIVFNFVSLDGYYCGQAGEIDWHQVDDEFHSFAVEQLDEVGTPLFGRVTYEMMAGYWTSEMAVKNDPAVAGPMNRLPKIVFSRTLVNADWNNSTVSARVPQTIHELRGQTGKNLFIFGSGQIVQACAQRGLIDEYRIMVNPVVLGSGRSMFQGVSRFPLKLVKSRAFRNGNVLLCYAPCQ